MARPLAKSQVRDRVFRALHEAGLTCGSDTVTVHKTLLRRLGKDEYPAVSVMLGRESLETRGGSQSHGHAQVKHRLEVKVVAAVPAGFDSDEVEGVTHDADDRLDELEAAITRRLVSELLDPSRNRSVAYSFTGTDSDVLPETDGSPTLLAAVITLSAEFVTSLERPETIL